MNKYAINIECIGMPGAGKTTVVETFISEVGMNDKIFNDVRSYHLFLRYNKYTGRLIKFFEWHWFKFIDKQIRWLRGQFLFKKT